MLVVIWETLVIKKDGAIMYFEIIVPLEVRDSNQVYRYGEEYLKSKGLEGQSLTPKECSFCHVETVKSEWENDIRTKGYFVYEMHNCGG